MRRYVFLLCFLLAGCGVATRSSDEMTSNDKRNIASNLEAGKAVILADVYDNGDRCSSSRVFVQNKKTNMTAGLFNSSLSLGIYKNYTTLQPGDYWVKTVMCNGATVDMGGFAGGYLPGFSSKMNALSPQFSVAAGELLHIGTIRINTIKERSFFSDERVIVTREATSDKAKADLMQEFPELKAYMKFSGE